MKRTLFILLLFLCLHAGARNFYVSNLGSDGFTAAQAQNPATPWRTLAKVNAYMNSLLPGDQILLRRGDVFYGRIIANKDAGAKSGTAANPIVIGAYGTGDIPIISGFVTIGGWVSLGGGVYESAAAIGTLNTCNVVMIDGRNTAMGRFPDAGTTNDGYLNADAVGGAGTTITDAALPASTTTSFAGGEIGVRRSRYQLYRYSITGHNTRTLTYTPAYTLSVNNGYFVQNHPATVTVKGEWYYNPGTRKLRVHFGATNPATVVVKASTIDTLAYTYNLDYITYNNIAFEGANDVAVAGYSATANNVINCTIKGAGRNAVLMKTSKDCEVLNNVIEDVGSNGVSMTLDGGGGGYGGFKVRDNVIRRIGIIRGAGLDEDNKYNGVNITGSHNYVERNRIDSVGYAAVMYSSHDSIYMRNNHVTNYCLILDDGGAFYTSQHTATFKTLRHRVIENNIILYSGDPRAGVNTSQGGTYGVYIDDGANGVDILYNTIGFVSHEAIYIHNAFNVRVIGNTAYGFAAAALRLTHNSTEWPKIRGIEVKHNYFVSRESSSTDKETMIYAQTDESDPTFSGWGVIDSNYYASPIDVSKPFMHRLPGDVGYISFASWKNKTEWDDHSIFLNKSYVGAVSPIDSFRLEINTTNAPITIGLGKKYIDAKGTVYNGTITLQPYRSVALLSDGMAGETGGTGGDGEGPTEPPQPGDDCQPRAIRIGNKVYVIKVSGGLHTIKICD